MKKKRACQAAPLQQVRVVELLPLVMAGCIVARDIAKQKLVVAMATLAGEVVKLFRFDHPTETREFLRVVEALCVGVEGRNVTAAMDSTGTYADALRHQLTCAGVPERMVSPKRTHDSQELFDGVRSLHDPKSATLIAKLCAMGLSTPTSARRRTCASVRWWSNVSTSSAAKKRASVASKPSPHGTGPSWGDGWMSARSGARSRC